ncbi:Coenzyme F420-reducing hydrogenase, beta subunit [Devosia crocina]|uniref:Coenzyme F420-reducing hydrogenase, beta subunit n=1 Tax=Devosia crocina TaxID=429728 RepID=A0A1I7NLE4_9HYPH|nr:Coenzyme F420 hydrogenase/dehydrogenase, beta subunit C-terminal domain [Devosia crocina]SFV35491.1 Coenzyme F420-reducing hydrogenase, beta subunit [Devosia crocina]
MALDRYGQFKPVGPTESLREKSAQLARMCPFSPHARNEDAIAAERFSEAPERDGRLGHYETAYVGAVREAGFRGSGSSGGMVTWVAAELLRLGLVDGVAHVAPSAGSGFFRYTISRTAEALHEGAKSRYYPVELSGVLDKIRRVPGRYAVVGVPCFIKAIHLQRETDPVLAERISYTLGLFCGHMKSARLVESFAWQMDTAVEAVERPEFRIKGPERPANWYTAHLTLRSGDTRQKDWFYLADGDWGAGFFQNSACNWCDDVLAETADIAFGDAWVEPYSSDWRGTNVVVIRDRLLRDVVGRAIADERLDLRTVDADYIANTQAAGLRQRREGLGYRLTWRRGGLRPRKRVEPSTDLPIDRKFIYRLRYGISAWSHRMFSLARHLAQPKLYLSWARMSLGLYQGLAYGRGRAGALARRLRLTDRND